MTRPVLVLVDLQEDYLGEPGLEPHRDRIVAGAAELLRSARANRVPVIHVHTKVELQPDTRMRHWQQTGRRSCVAGTPGQASPEALAPEQGEILLEKASFGVGGDGLSEAARG